MFHLGRKQEGLGIAQRREEYQKASVIAGVGSFEFSILRRTSIVSGIGQNVVRFLPVTQQMTPLLSLYYPSHLGF